MKPPPVKFDGPVNRRCSLTSIDWTFAYIAVWDGVNPPFECTGLYRRLVNTYSTSIGGKKAIVMGVYHLCINEYIDVIDVRRCTNAKRIKKRRKTMYTHICVYGLGSTSITSTPLLWIASGTVKSAHRRLFATSIEARGLKELISPSDTAQSTSIDVYGATSLNVYGLAVRS